MAEKSNVTTIDGSLDFSGGVNSNCVTTIASALNAQGIPRNMLPWLVNGTIRNGGIRPRSGWQPKGTLFDGPSMLARIASGTQLYQGGFLYDPLGANPYPVFLLGGTLYAIMDVDNASVVVDLTGGLASLQMTPAIPQAFFQQGEQFLIIQAGDYTTLPLFWDGSTLRRSNGLSGTPAELPAAGPMGYYMGRLWYAQGRSYAAGDIVDGPSGTPGPPYFTSDSILKVTENPLAIGGDGFTVPSTAGNIRWIGYAATLNTQLGQGVLFIGTRKQIYGLQVPVTRTDWIGANSSNMPLQYAVALSTGPVNDRSVVQCNSDLFFQTLQPSIQSLAASVRNFSQWGNVPISVNENRILAFNDRSLLWASSGIFFDNRVLQTAMPFQSEFGVLHPSLIPLNFDTISSMSSQLPPAWEGQLTGLDMLQLFCGDFGGLDRAFALVISRTDGSLQLWELTQSSRTDNGDNRIDWIVEFPAYTWDAEFSLKELMTLELWLDDVRGTVVFTLDYRPDSDSCFYPWHKWKVCAARDSNETLDPINPYPTQCGPGYESTITLPHPPIKCAAFTGRPAFMGYQFQTRLTVHGWCRIRGIFLHSASRERELYARKVC